jgi:putative nucleotidyltransferase with HDIG domain
VNHAEVHVANKRVGEAMADADEALGVFTMLGSKMDMAAAHKQIGIVCRETGALHQAEERFVNALGLAVATGSALVEADTCREMALLYRKQGRNQDALQLLNRAHALFGKLDARADLIDVAAATRKLEDTFVKVVREWGLSIESADSYTYGHCNRVAEYGVQVAAELGLTATELTTINLGAYLHDLGKIEVPPEILNKTGRLTPEEFDIIKRHPEAGARMLDKVEFPWDLKPIIRWHHEKDDGTGYPDQLVGDEIPLHAQIICIADVYDAITTNRSYRKAFDKAKALETMRECAHWWRPDVFEAFLRVADRLEATVATPSIEAAA